MDYETNNNDKECADISKLIILVHSDMVVMGWIDFFQFFFNVYQSKFCHKNVIPI